MSPTLSFNDMEFGRLPDADKVRCERQMRDFDFCLSMGHPWLGIGTTNVTDKWWKLAIVLWAERHPTVPVKYRFADGPQCDVAPGTAWHEL